MSVTYRFNPKPKSQTGLETQTRNPCTTAPFNGPENMKKVTYESVVQPKGNI